SRVFLARDIHLDRTVALKVYYHLGDRPEVVERFSREARAVAFLNHPNICTVYEVGFRNGHYYLVMAYVEGQPLWECVEDLAADPRRAAEVVCKVARAVHYAHERGLLHCDLKPANIMLDRRGEPIVMDFGLARPVESDESSTQEGVFIGTPAYMPPEQATG